MLEVLAEGGGLCGEGGLLTILVFIFSHSKEEVFNVVVSH